MTEIKEEYGGALFSLAEESGASGEILSDVKSLIKLFESQLEYVKLMSAPNVKKEERTAMLDEAFRNQVNIYTLNFMKLLVECGYFYDIIGCLKEFVKAYNIGNNIEVVTVISPVTLNQSQKDKLCVKLSKKLGKTIELNERIDPSLIGGVRIEMQSDMLDGSVKSRLDDIKEILSNTVL